LRNTISPEEYLRLERASEEKHEYADGGFFVGGRIRVTNGNVAAVKIVAMNVAYEQELGTGLKNHGWQGQAKPLGHAPKFPQEAMVLGGEITLRNFGARPGFRSLRQQDFPSDFVRPILFAAW
jgi:hypothetical protein